MMNSNISSSGGGDKQLIDLINGLTLAIQRGEITLNQQQQQNNKNQSFANVNNLSNQTFNYIINWLKQQSQSTNGVSSFHSFSAINKTKEYALCFSLM